MPVHAPTRAGDRPVCAEPENLELVDRAHGARGKGAPKVHRLFFETCCAPCGLREACLSAAIEGGEHGLWGGTTERQRHAMGYRRSYTHNLNGIHTGGPIPGSGSAA